TSCRDRLPPRSRAETKPRAPTGRLRLRRARKSSAISCVTIRAAFRAVSSSAPRGRPGNEKRARGSGNKERQAADTKERQAADTKEREASAERSMTVFDKHRDALERHETMMGPARGRLAVALDLLTDSLALVGQHGVYCRSERVPGQPKM